MKPVIVFLGPSLPLADARALLDADYRPPCRMGDVHAALRSEKPAAIGIVDGFFESTPAVWHKEILFALSQGVPVFGAASMGALRAAELAPFGMSGIGRIFRDYAGGALTDDDEVAVSHGPAEDGYPLGCDPMVNLRHGLAAAREAGIIDHSARDRAIMALKAVYYPQRRWSLLWDGADGIGHGLAPGQQAALRDFIQSGDFDLKRSDARELLRAIAAWRAEGARPHVPDFTFQPTIFWDHMCSLVEPAAAPGGGNGAAAQAVTDHLRIASSDRRRIMFEALGRRLIAREVRRIGLAAGDDRSVLARFRQDRGLNSAAALSEWMAANRLDRGGVMRLARTEAQARILARRMMPELLAEIPDLLRSHGGFADAHAAATATARSLQRRGITEPAIDHAGGGEALLAWYQRLQGAVTVPLDEHVAELGFGNRQQFMRALVAAYLGALDQEDGNERTDRKRA